MSLKLAQLMQNHKGKKLSRQATLGLLPAKTYDDGRTKQCYADECDISKIMARYDTTGTISHLAKHQGQYADFSDYDFHENTRMLTRGREVFDELPAELRREFNQSPAAFFEHVNNPENRAKPNYGLAALAQPGRQLRAPELPSADLASAEAAKQSVDLNPTETPPADPPAG